MSLHITCPECSTPANLPDEMLGRKVRCRQCRAIFAVREAMEDAEPVEIARSYEDEADDGDRPRRRPVRRSLEDDEVEEVRPARPRKSSRLPAVLIGTVAGSLLCLGIIGAVLVLSLPRREAPQFQAGPIAPPIDPFPIQNFMPGMQPAPIRPPAQMPALPAAQQVEPGIVVHKVSLGSGANPREVFIYLPAKHTGRLPVVLIAPAGSPLILGMDLSNGDTPEHLPYVRAGFAVVAYSLDGACPNFQNLPPIVWLSSVRYFMQAECGVENARVALDYALSHVPALDPERVYTAGHSSAATVSLLVAEHDSRIKGCIAYAPVTNLVHTDANARVIRQLDQVIPGCANCFFKQWSPIKGVAELTCPTFLFHAENDSVVDIEQSSSFAARLRRTNTNVTFVRARSGNHQDSMMKEGIPQAITWLKKQAGM